MSFIYLIHATGTNLYKIGFATDAKKRLRGMQTGCPHKLNLLDHRAGSVRDEKFLHAKHKTKRRQGEWFEFKGDAVALAAFRGHQRRRTPEEIRKAVAERQSRKVSRFALQIRCKVYHDHIPIAPSTMGLKRWTVEPGDFWHQVAEEAMKRQASVNYREIARFMCGQIDNSYVQREPLFI